MRETISDYIALTKPRVLSLLLWTTVTTMIVARPDDIDPLLILITAIGGYGAAGGAGAINHYLDRDRDAQMTRTKGRPIVSGRISPRRALVFGIALGTAAILLLGFAVNWLAAGLALVGLIGYAVVYTLWLKPATPQNIVLGGAAGAIPPLVGWAAATGSLSWDAGILFAIVFFWTPPHFWALALMIKDDYARIGVPMMPVVRGDAHTAREIVLYSLVVTAFSLLPFVTGLLGWFYFGAALALDAVLITLAVPLLKDASKPNALRLYLFSLAYLALLFLAMAFDAVLG